MAKNNPESSGGSLRIVAGTLRGSRLAVPDVTGLRPTSDRVRETLFNWLAPIIVGARCLDLYAGTGALGIEALSRGAASCVFVERDRGLCELLRQNLGRLRVDGALVVNDDAQGFVAAPEPKEPFDLVFLDPPFAANLWTAAAQRLEQGVWLRAGAHIYVETAASAIFDAPASWGLQREGRAGAVRFALYRRIAHDPLS
ncbi:MAG: 16S rRNA (guanine(966)-N(2))-methyltransferase RsmD [Dokdonella sp.]